MGVLDELEDLKISSDKKSASKKKASLIEKTNEIASTESKPRKKNSISLDMYQAKKARKQLSKRNSDINKVQYSKLVCQEILACYANSSMPTFRKFYNRNKQPYWPNIQTFLNWMSMDRDGFGTIKLQLDMVRYTSYIDEIVDIADDNGDDYLYEDSVDSETGEATKTYRLDHNGNPIKNAAKLERDKLKIETRFKVMKSMLPDIASRLESHKPESKAEALVDRLATALEKIELKSSEKEVVGVEINENNS